MAGGMGGLRAAGFLAAHLAAEARARVEDCRAVLPDDGIISLDSGVHHNWFMQFWEARRPQAMLNTWGFSAMGFGVSGILGAKLAAPHRPCLAVCGDGGFVMT